MFYFHFYYLPKHIHYDHIDHPESKNVSAKVDFVMYLFKFLSYFVVNLSLFQALAQSKIDVNVIFTVNFALIWLYFFFHINRNDKVSPINVFMAGLFACISSLVIINSRTSVTNFSAAVATLIFYLSSGIYYHKVDGTLDYKVLIEYSSIAAILSVFLFAV
jgi:hypothetical protein